MCKEENVYSKTTRIRILTTQYPTRVEAKTISYGLKRRLINVTRQSTLVLD